MGEWRAADGELQVEKFLPENVSYAYEDGVQSLRNVNLRIYPNQITVIFSPAGMRDRVRLDELVERSLRAAALWDEVKDGLDEPTIRLSGGRQQRLCLAHIRWPWNRR